MWASPKKGVNATYEYGTSKSGRNLSAMSVVTDISHLCNPALGAFLRNCHVPDVLSAALMHLPSSARR